MKKDLLSGNNFCIYRYSGTGLINTACFASLWELSLCATAVQKSVWLNKATVRSLCHSKRLKNELTNADLFNLLLLNGHRDLL